MQKLRAPDVMPDEYIFVLTKTEMFKPGCNLLRSPEVNCQRWKSRDVEYPKAQRKASEKDDQQQTPKKHESERQNSINIS